MKATFYKKGGDGSVDEVGTLPKPDASTLKPPEMLLKVHAASLNPVDFKLRQLGSKGKAFTGATFPATHGFDFVGTVETAGETAQQKFNVGDIVFGRADNEHRGSLAEYMVVLASSCAKKPENVDDNDAASIPLVGITAVHCFRACKMVENNPEGTKKRVLILGGAGGVGTCAIQLAKNLYKADFVATTASPGAKTKLCEELGADLVVNYKDDPKLDALKEVDPFDCVIDAVGTLNTGLPFLAKGGTCCSVLGPATSDGLDDLLKRMPKGLLKSIAGSGIVRRGINWATGANALRKKLKKKGATYEFVLIGADGDIVKMLGDEMQEGRLKAVIEKVFPLSEGKEAVALLEAGRVAGKVVVSVQN